MTFLRPNRNLSSVQFGITPQKDVDKLIGKIGKMNDNPSGYYPSDIPFHVAKMATEGRYHEAADKLEQRANNVERYGGSFNKKPVRQMRAHAQALRAIRRADPSLTASLESENETLRGPQEASLYPPSSPVSKKPSNSDLAW